MIVPFLFGVEEDPIHYLWIFYKYMDFCLKNNCPIIAQESYFEKPSILREKKGFVFKDIKNGYNELYEFKEPTDKRIKRLKRSIITKEEEENVFSKYNNKHDAFVSLLKQRNNEVEKIIEEKINEVEKIEKEKIDFILTWIWFPSLEYVAKKHNIIVLTQEQTTFRKPTYNMYLGYCCEGNKYTDEIAKNEYKLFKQSNNNKFLSREEILALFLSKNNLKYISESKKNPIYEFGIDLGMDKDAPNDVFSQFDNHYKIDHCKKLVSGDKISARTHPLRPSKVKYKVMDKSANSIEWIIKCRRIVSTVSNTGFETMLYGRTAYILGNKMPFCVQAINSLDHVDDYLCETKFLNYITFGYFVPFDLMYNKKYLIWRHSNDINKVYDYNLKHILRKYKIDNTYFTKNKKERLKIILMKVHNYTSKEADKIMNQFDLNYDEIMEEKNKVQNELMTIKNSKGWRILEKLRKFKNRG